MKIQAVQVMTIIRYEVHMQWTRRLLPMLLVMLLIPLVAIVMIVRQQVLETSVMGDVASSVDVAEMLTENFSMLMVVLGVMLPVLIAETIPRDRHFGVRQLLDSLPMKTNIYLMGKVLSVWIGIGGSVFCVFLFISALSWFLLGAYDAGHVLTRLLVMMVGVVYTTAMGTLLAAGQPTRRRAALVGMGFAFAYLFLLPIISVLLVLIVPGFSELASPPVEDGALVSVESMLVQLAAVWTLVWWWMRREYAGG